MELREYVITLYKKEDLESFYEDMETTGGNLYIPNRKVEVAIRRPMSRNTHYMLTDEEAELVKKDPRVMNVELTLSDQGIVFRPLWNQSSSNWNKSGTISNTHRNWALLRCSEGSQRPNWGSNGTANQSGAISVNASGKHVDVVIVDGHMNPDHPEFAKNSDGTGLSRVVQYNWFQHNPELGLAFNTYLYTPYVDSSYNDLNADGYSDRTIDNDHGCHVAGTACGNSQGWARDSNIYNISPYITSPSYSNFFLDYIKLWHISKPVNPVTGIRNPTITNHSYGLGFSVDIETITQVRYRGIIYNGPFTSAQLMGYGIFNFDGFTSTPARSVAFEQDLLDLIDLGIIVVGAAGNEYSKIDMFSSNPSNDYNNYFVSFGVTYFYNRGTITSAGNIICVGAISSLVSESKADFSNCGPRVDLYAPGRHIMSSINSNIRTFVSDSRNSSFYQNKESGTSMAAPQVTGVLACLLETWPTLKQNQAIDYLKSKSKLNQITDTGGGVTDYSALQGSENRFLYYFKERLDSGQVYPKLNQGNRSTTGMTYPRPKIYRYGS